MSTRDFWTHIEELNAIGESASLISKITDAVLEDVTAWQNRPLESVYAIMYFGALRVKIRDEGSMHNRAMYLAIGITCNGYKEVLGCGSSGLQDVQHCTIWGWMNWSGQI